MRRTLFRVTVGALVAAVVAAVASSALASHRPGFGPRMGVHVFRAGGFGPGGLMGGGMMFGGPGFGIKGFAGPGMGPEGPGGGGALTSDVLTPAASFLGITVATLASDLSGGKTLADEAKAKNKTADDLINAIVAAQKTNLDNEKAAGWITADQEKAILARYKDAVTDLVNNGPPVPLEGKGGGLLSSAATFLGMSVADLQADLEAGKTLADEAKAKGKSVDDLVTALLAPTKKNLDQLVTDQKITQAQENAILSHMTTALTNLVNNAKPSDAKLNAVRNNVVHFATLTVFGKSH